MWLKSEKDALDHDVPGSADVPVGMVENKADEDVGAPRTTNAALSTVYDSGDDAGGRASA